MTLLVDAAGSRVAGTVFTVNTVEDVSEPCTSERCSLRAAIEAANSLEGRDTIAFNLPGLPPAAIRPELPLPKVYDPVVIDATTQPGYRGDPVVEIDGSVLQEAGSAETGLTIEARDTTVKGLILHGFGINATLVITAGSHNNVIQNNWIGLTRDGRGSGSYVGLGLGNSRNTLVGGTTPIERNVISGNYHGLYAGGIGTGTRIIGNYVGTDPSGTKAAERAGAYDITNTRYGIVVAGSQYRVGGPLPGEANLISGNAVGVHFEQETSFDNVLQGNIIGLGSTGAPVPNTESGVSFSWGAHDNLVGGKQSGTGNVIAHSNAGIVVGHRVSPKIYGPNTRNAFLGNSIFSNPYLGIDLSSGYGVAPNDRLDRDAGPNGLQNYPVIEDAVVANNTVSLEGRLRSTPDKSFRLEFFDNQECHGLGHGEGQRFLGTIDVRTNARGVSRFTASFVLPAQLEHWITATATNSNGSTSEFSRCVQAD